MTIQFTLQFISNGCLVIIPNPSSSEQAPQPPHVHYAPDKDQAKLFINQCIDAIKIADSESVAEPKSTAKQTAVVQEAIDKVVPLNPEKK